MNTIKLEQFKQGDDYNGILEQNKVIGGANVYSKALRQHAAMLRRDAESLDRVANLIDMLDEESQKKVKVSGDTHTLVIKGPDVLIKQLKKQGLV